MQATRRTPVTDPSRTRLGWLDPRLIWGLIAIVGAVIDQSTKNIALAEFRPGEYVQVIGNLLRFTLAFNDGAAFSLGGGLRLTWVFTLFSSAVLIAVTIYCLCKLQHRGWAVVFGLLTAGVVGNLIDRLFRPPSFGFGHVVDFLVLPNWPIFNFADVFVCAAAAGMVWLAVIKNVPPGRPAAETKTEEKSGVDVSPADEQTK